MLIQTMLADRVPREGLDGLPENAKPSAADGTLYEFIGWIQGA